MRAPDLPRLPHGSFPRGQERCALPRICGTIEQTKSLWEEPDAGGKPLEEALTKRGHLASGRLSQGRGVRGLLLLRIESP